MIVDVNQIKFYTFLSAALAQLVEHLIRNEGVTGSNPVVGSSPGKAYAWWILRFNKILAVNVECEFLILSK